MWLQHDEHNLSPGGAGLIIWPKKPPAAWSFEQYNSEGKNNFRQAREAFVAGVQPTVVPYRFNRAVVFDSDFFHKSAPSHFKHGHHKRRINITFLFGKRAAAPG